MKSHTKYNLIVMIEDTISSKIWKDEIEQLKEKLSQEDDFINIQFYYFDKNKDEKITVKNNNNDILNNSDILNINKNVKDKNNLVMIVSDVCSKIWHNNQVYETINNLSKNSLVSIVNILPKNMWRGLAVDTFLEVKSTLPLDVQSNANIVNKFPNYLDKEEVEHIIVMPMIELHETDKLLNSIKYGGQIQSTFLYDDNLSLSIDNHQPQSAKTQVNRYISKVFQPAVRLAQYFSNIESFTISDLEYVRKHMLLDTDKSTIAQFLLGGIIDKEDSNDKLLKSSYSEMCNQCYIKESEEIRYKMKPGIADEFKRFSNNYDNERVRLLLEDKIQQSYQITKKLKI